MAGVAISSRYTRAEMINLENITTEVQTSRSH
jgi:hypothetical protein